MSKFCFPILTQQELTLPFYISSVGYGQEHITMRETGLKEAQFLYTAEGVGTGEMAGEPIRLLPGSLMYFPPFTPHAYQPEQEHWRTYWITFGGYAAEQLIQAEAAVWEQCSFDFPERIQALCRLYQTSDWQRESSVLLYALLLRCREMLSMPLQSRLKTRLHHAFRYIDEHLEENFSLLQLSEACGISKEYFCKIFKDYTGMRPMEYVTYVRIQNAKKMLLHSDLSISEIARRTGFSDSSYFSKTFKRLESVTPMQFSGRGKAAWMELPNDTH